jgi:hypothetical protein
MPQRYPASVCLGMRLGGYPYWGTGDLDDNRWPGFMLPRVGDHAAMGCLPPMPVGPPYQSLVGLRMEGGVWWQSGSSTTEFEVFFASGAWAKDEGWSTEEFPTPFIEDDYYQYGTYSFTQTCITEIVAPPVPMMFGAPNTYNINGSNSVASGHWWHNSWFPWVRVLSGGVRIVSFEVIEYPIDVPRGTTTGELRGRTVAWDRS